jgi:O-antigen ligase
MVVFLPLAIYFAMALKPHVGKIKTFILWALPVTAFIGVLASSSRGGQLGAAAAIGVVLLKRRLKVRTLLAGAGVAVVIALLLPPEQYERFTEMGEDGTSQQRFTLWEDGLEIMSEHPTFGIGYGNWLPYYHTHYNPEGQVVHNIFLEAGTEMGYVGLVLLLFGLSTVFLLNFKTRRLANRLGPDGRLFTAVAHGLDAGLVGFMVSGFFVTVLYYPFFWIQLALTVSLHATTLGTARRLGFNSYRLPATRLGRNPGPARAHPGSSPLNNTNAPYAKSG